MPHARGRSQRGERRCDDACQHLEDHPPSLLVFHINSSFPVLITSLRDFGSEGGRVGPLGLTSRHPSPFTLHRLIVPVVATFAARVASGVVTTAGASVLGAAVVVVTIRGVCGSVLVLGVFHLARG